MIDCIKGGLLFIMFDKIITDAQKSPSLVKELVDYKSTLAKNLSKRGILVILSGLFLIVQYVSMLQNPNFTNNADTNSDTIYGGFSSKQEMLLQYDSKNSNFHRAASALSISRNDLEKVKSDNVDWINTKPSLLVAWSRSPVYKPSLELSSMQNSSFLAQSNNDNFLYYGQVISKQRLDISSQEALTGYSAYAGKFAVLKNSGNFLTDNIRADTCYKKPGDYNFYLSCPNSNSIKTEMKITNITYKADAEFVKNHASDRLQYDLKITNHKPQKIELKPQIYLGDILEYSELTNVENAVFNNKDKNLQWPKTTISSGKTKTYTFSVKILDKTPLNPRGISNYNSFDCRMGVFVGTTKDVRLFCPAPKTIERMLNHPTSPIIIGLVWFGFIVNLLLYTRTYVLIIESDIILRDIRRKHV